MNESTKKLALAHALEQMPDEACGLVVNVGGKPRYHRCRNIADKPREYFVLHPDDYAAAEDSGQVITVVHSHPYTPAVPSPADLEMCEQSGLPWAIVSVPTGVWHEFAPRGYVAPLYGRPFVHGVHDCYTFIRDWYSRERAIKLPDFDHPDNWWRSGGNLYVDGFARAGFEQCDKLHHGAVLLMQMGDTRVPNHGAVFLESGHLAHHMYNRLSCMDVYGGWFEKHTTHILRYMGNASNN